MCLLRRHILASGAFGAGYSYCEIAEYLEKSHSYDIKGAKEAGLSCAEVARYLGKPESWRE